MSTEENVETVKDFFAAMGRGDREALLALAAEDIEWIIPGEDWPLAGTYRGHAGLAEVLRDGVRSRSRHRTRSPGSLSPRETGCWWSASPRGKSRPRTSRSRMTGSSPSRFGTAS